MNKMAWWGWNPIHRCFDRGDSPEQFGTSTAMRTRLRGSGVETVEFEYGAPFQAPYDASDEELTRLAGAR